MNFPENEHFQFLSVTIPARSAISSDAGILLARQAEERLQICFGLSECIQEWRIEMAIAPQDRHTIAPSPLAHE